MAPGLAPRAFVLAIIGVVLAAGLAMLAAPARAGTAVVFIEDFESGTLSARWSEMDGNAASGLDYWGISNYRVHTGNYSAWCAEVGTQAATGQNNTAARQYDNNMQADLSIDLRVSGFTSLTLSFYYWSKSESGGGDYLEAWYVAGGVPTMIFQNRGSSAWSLVSLAVPTNVETLVIRFTSDASNNNFEGAYVDDVVMTGTEGNPPASNALPLPTYVNSTTVNVRYAATDGVNESGVQYVELWYRQGTTGNFTLYTRPANPLGQWIASPARFDITYAAGDGYYEFYTIAVDNASNREAPPAGPDASTTVDTTAPTIQITSPGADTTFSVSEITFTWDATDALSGIDHFEVWLDNGTHQTLTDRQTALANIPEGAHTFHVVAVDRAGNSRETSVAFTVTMSPFPWWLVILILAILLFILLFLWRRKKSEDDRTSAPPSKTEAPEEPAGPEDSPEPELAAPDPPSPS